MRHVVSRVFLIALTASLLPPVRTAVAQTEEAIEQARLKGVEYLKTTQQDDGSWEFESHPVGITALCSLALIENGVGLSDPVVSKAVNYVRKNAGDLTNTYDLALTIVVLSRVGDRDDRQLIREMAARLIAGQNEEGGWSYTCPKATVLLLTDRSARPELQKGRGDNSCTQFATLGLWTASRWGVNVNDVMDQMALRFIDTQLYNGAWSYNFWDEKDGSQESMTYAGLFCLAVAKAAKIREEQSGRPTRRPLASDTKKGSKKGDKGEKEKAKEPPPAQRTLAQQLGVGGQPASTEKRERVPKMEARAAFESAPVLNDTTVYSKGLERAGQVAGGISAGSARYFLWSVERLGVILGLEEFGQTKWFNQGAQALISAQKEDGSWTGAWGDKCDTAFAILFLRKANLGSDISRLLAGEPTQRFLISSRADQPRYGAFDEAIKNAQPGETIRIDGNGPFEAPHLEFSQDLTIQAGPGYSPVLRYDIGNDAGGARSRPESDPNARHMVRVNGGTLTLEGLALRMDTPSIPVSDWSGVIVNGGDLRMLNCSISEDRKNKMVALRIVKPGSVQLRNCLFVGGVSAIEVEPSGEQSVALENSVLFSDKAIATSPVAPQGAASLSLVLRRCSIQANDVFAFPKLASQVQITSEGCAYKGTWLGSQMLSAPNDHANLTWTGSNNIYDVSRWIGSAGTASTKVKDAKSFADFMGGADEKGQNKPLAFAGKKPNGAFNHEIQGEDFELAANSNVYVYRLVTGVDPLVVGPGNGFLRFRDSFDYRDWQRGPGAAVAAK